MELLQKLNTTAQPRDRPFSKDNDNKIDSTKEEENIKKERRYYICNYKCQNKTKNSEKEIALN